MPKECLASVKYKDGHVEIAAYRLADDMPFGFSEMKRWIMERTPDVVEVSVSKVPAHLRKAIHKAIDAEDDAAATFM